MAAEVVAMRRRERDEAAVARDAALAEVRAVQERIDRRRTAQSEITQRRLDGVNVPGDAAELAALERDCEALTSILEEKRAAAHAIDVNGAAARLAEAEAAHRREQDEAALAAMQQRCVEHDLALVSAVQATLALSARLGKPRQSQVYRFSAGLRRMAAQEGL